jgi:uncharacterized repeat protein (TIGR03847 family)
MANTEIDLNPVDFITIGTIGPKGKRVFHLQAGYGDKLVSFTIEKEQAWALSEAINEFIDNLDEKNERETDVQMSALDMDLREPIQPLFRIAQMGLGYDEDEDMIILIAQEMLPQDADHEAGVVRMWCSSEQMRALSIQATDMVESGRPSPKQNGRIKYYWT